MWFLYPNSYFYMNHTSFYISFSYKFLFIYPCCNTCASSNKARAHGLFFRTSQTAVCSCTFQVSLKRKKKNKCKFTQEERSWECFVKAYNKIRMTSQLPPYHSCLQVTHMHFPQQLKHKECSEEGSATHKGLFLLHSCAPSMKDKGTWAVSS